MLSISNIPTQHLGHNHFYKYIRQQDKGICVYSFATQQKQVKTFCMTIESLYQKYRVSCFGAFCTLVLICTFREGEFSTQLILTQTVDQGHKKL